ncbi:MAG TPA: Gfo/Idh/MocA family oxidoreductase, partial [Gemmatales bacterium]|nr:Gfo/Idh/MocA family oxidoreductase [Gemmatales bacterium]
MITRRRFLAASTVSLAASSYMRVLGANSALGVAIIGVGGQGGYSLSTLAKLERIVALCDVDSKRVAKERSVHADAYFTQDFREVVDRKEVDAVAVCTPDHTHAPIAMAALKAQKHVYCEKPLCHTIHEIIALMQEARTRKLVTQMGTQIHAGDNYRRVVELIQQGVIGEVREVHTWVPGDYYAGDFPKDQPPIPEGLHYDLWLGPAEEQPYHPCFLPFNWRRYWKFGTGRLGDMACHHMDLPMWALGLGMPLTVETEGPPVHAEGCPRWVIARYTFARPGGGTPIELTWYDGDKRPPLLNDPSFPKWGAGNIFVGSQGLLLADYSRYLLHPSERFEGVKPSGALPASPGHHKEWCDAIRGKGKPLCQFDYSGPLSLAVQLGTVAYRAGQKLEWDADKLWVKSSTPALDKLL